VIDIAIYCMRGRKGNKTGKGQLIS